MCFCYERVLEIVECFSTSVEMIICFFPPLFYHYDVLHFFNGVELIYNVLVSTCTIK